jgi:hypothetical protein
MNSNAFKPSNLPRLKPNVCNANRDDSVSGDQQFSVLIFDPVIPDFGNVISSWPGILAEI